MTKKKTKLPEPRPVLIWFAGVMEQELRKHEDKGGWAGDDLEALMRHLDEEVDELDYTLSNFPSVTRILDECADVANLAMMIADNRVEGDS